MKENQEDDIIHQLTCEEFLSRFRRETSVLLCNIYASDIEPEQSKRGALTFPLCDDVFTLVDKQLSIIREYLDAKNLVGTSEGHDLISTVGGFILESLRYKQIHFRDNFLHDIENCCAAANTFMIMSERCETITKEILSMLQSKHSLTDDRSMTLQNLSSELASLYKADAIYCAQYVYIHVFEPIRNLLICRLFTLEWEDVFKENEIAASITKTIEDYFKNDISCYLDDPLKKQSVQSLLEATVISYLNAILIKAKKERHSSSCFFTDPERAVKRMQGDVDVMKAFFKNYFGVKDKIIEKKFFILDAVHECAATAVDVSDAKQHFKTSIVYIHSITKNAQITKLVVVDLFNLFAPDMKLLAKEHLRSLKKELKETSVVRPLHGWGYKSRRQVSGLCTETMLNNCYETELISKTKHEQPYTKFLPSSRHFRAKFTSMTSKRILSPKRLRDDVSHDKHSENTNILVLSYDEGSVNACSVIECIHPEPAEKSINEEECLGKLSADEFFSRFCSQTSDLLSNVHAAESNLDYTECGKLITELCADVFSVVNCQLRVLREYLQSSKLTSTVEQELVVDAACFIFESLRYHQTHFRDHCVCDFENCCAASNNFALMADLCEELLNMLKNEYDLTLEGSKTIETRASELIYLYQKDSVYAAQYIHIYVFQPIQEYIMDRLFQKDWEECSNNKTAHSIVRTIEDFLNDIEQYLSASFLVNKAVFALVEATVLFYIKALLTEAKRRRKSRNGCFISPKNALRRMHYDIYVLKNFYLGLASKIHAIDKVMTSHFAILDLFYELIVIYECTKVGTEISGTSIQGFVPLMYKRIGDFDLTRYCMADLFCLFAPSERQYIYDLVSAMKENVLTLDEAVKKSKGSGQHLNEQSSKDSNWSLDSRRNLIKSSSKDSNGSLRKREQMPGLSLDSVLQDIYSDDLEQHEVKVGDLRISASPKFLHSSLQKAMLTSFEGAKADATKFFQQTPSTPNHSLSTSLDAAKADATKPKRALSTPFFEAAKDDVTKFFQVPSSPNHSLSTTPEATKPKHSLSTPFFEDAKADVIRFFQQAPPLPKHSLSSSLETPNADATKPKHSLSTPFFENMKADVTKFFQQGPSSPTYSLSASLAATKADAKKFFQQAPSLPKDSLFDFSHLMPRKKDAEEISIQFESESREPFDETIDEYSVWV